METFLVSTGIVALAEIGDKTQLLSMILAARFRRPLPIAFGILGATLLNHAGAGYAGILLGGVLHGPWMPWILGLSFLGVAVWALFPDSIGEGAGMTITRRSAFAATLIAFFLAEIGDKTQIATVALAARYQALLLVTAGTTLGMMIANLPAVLCGHALAHCLPFKAIRIGAATAFAALGVAALIGFAP